MEDEIVTKHPKPLRGCSVCSKPNCDRKALVDEWQTPPANPRRPYAGYATKAGVESLIDLMAPLRAVGEVELKLPSVLNS